jgi:hypothetical protein
VGVDVFANAVLAGASSAGRLGERIEQVMSRLQQALPELTWGRHTIRGWLASAELLPEQVEAVIEEFLDAVAANARNPAARPITNRAAYFVAILKDRLLTPRDLAWGRRR